MRLPILLIWLISALAALTATGAQPVYRARGQVVDSLSREPVPYAAVWPVGAMERTLTDENGRFDISTSRSFTTIEVTALGFTPTRVDATEAAGRKITVLLPSTGVELAEVVARPKKEKYSKRNNPAVDFVRKIAEGGHKTDPRRNPYYGYDRYERITLALNNIDETSKLLKSAPELVQYLDTSEVSGSTILNISVKEKASEVHYRNNPRSEKTYVTGIRARGVDEVFDQQNVQTVLEDLLREVDLYEGDINILRNRFVSPLGHLAPDFYKFYLSDTVPGTTPESPRQIVLSFVPRTSESFGFTGRIFVEEGDTTYFIKRLEMNVPHNINMNFISHLYLNQEYDRAPDGSRLKTRDDMVVEIDIYGLGMYIRRNTAYSGHNFRHVNDAMFASVHTTEQLPGAEQMPDDFWERKRTVPISRAEASMGEMVQGLRSHRLYFYAEKFIHIMSVGYVGTRRDGKPSLFDLGPLNTTISHNSLEGWRMRLGGMTTAALSPRWFARGYVAYGTRDRKVKYMAEMTHSFRERRVHPNEFPVHSISVSSKYDVDMLGQQLLTNADNVFLSLKRRPDHQIAYHHIQKVAYNLELWNNFSISASAYHERILPSQWMTFVNGYGTTLPHINTTGLELTLRYAPGEKFVQQRSMRVPINFDAPIFTLRHRWAPKGLMGSQFAVSVTEASVAKRVWFSAFGYADVTVKGGHVWSRSPYTALLMPAANLSYIILPESFALMDPMEFINDSYAAWFVDYTPRGLLFNHIPLIKKLKLREFVSFRGVWGHLSRRNDPDCNPQLPRFPAEARAERMTSEPYMELAVGIDNILRCLRVDYVWRLTYRHIPDATLGGLRIAVHFTF